MRFDSLLSILFFFLPFSSSVLISKTQIPLLKSIQTEFKDKVDFATWDFSSDCEYFEYIACDKNGNITSMEFYDHGLEGSIPSEIGNIPSLLILDLSSNSFDEIPSTFKNLNSLIELDLSNNSISGSIPSFFKNFIFLNVLDLSNNKFDGEFPSFITKFSRLNQLLLYGNSFYGNLPNDISSLKNLRIFHIHKNEIEGNIPYSIGTMQELEEINFSSNKFSGQIPSSVGNLTYLYYLDLSDNLFNGIIPNTIGNLKALENFLINNNKIQGTIPEEIGNCLKLRQIYMQKNEISGSLPASIANLTLLNILNLMNNSISGKVPASLTSISTSIWLYGNPICQDSNAIINPNLLCDLPNSKSYVWTAPVSDCEKKKFICSSKQALNRYKYDTTNECDCSDYVHMILRLENAEFDVLTAAVVQELREKMSSEFVLGFSQIWVNSSKIDQDGKRIVEFEVFKSKEESLGDILKWFKEGFGKNAYILGSIFGKATIVNVQEIDNDSSPVIGGSIIKILAFSLTFGVFAIIAVLFLYQYVIKKRSANMHSMDVRRREEF